MQGKNSEKDFSSFYRQHKYTSVSFLTLGEMANLKKFDKAMN